jgi:hypothetical protein
MIPRELSSLFWDIDTESFVPQDYPEYTMERILELGDSEAVKWLEVQFSEEQIKEVIRTSRRLSKKSANFWALVYEIPSDEVTFTEGVVNEDDLLQSLQNLQDIQVVSKSTETLHLHIGKTKVSFIGYHYPILFPSSSFDGISIADPRDISAMKLSALASRGATSGMRSDREAPAARRRRGLHAPTQPPP